jgi:hypothetical protein
MSSKREQYRESARECIRVAEVTTDVKLRRILRQHAQEWLKLAYAEQDDRFQDAIAAFNTDKLIAPVQRQPLQQQQGKLEPKDE